MPNSRDRGPWYTVAVVSTAGLTLALSVAIGALLGYGLDRLLGTKWIILIGFVLGVVAGFREFFRTMAKVIEADDDGGGGPSNGGAP